MAGFLDLDAVRDVAHEVETMLDLARNAQARDYPAGHRPDTGEQGLSEPLDVASWKPCCKPGGPR